MKKWKNEEKTKICRKRWKKKEKWGNLDSHAESSTFSRFGRCCCIFFRQNLLRFPWFYFGMCLFPEENQQLILGCHLFFLRKVTIFIGRETKHTFNLRKSTKKMMRSALFINYCSFARIQPSNCNNQQQLQQLGFRQVCVALLVWSFRSNPSGTPHGWTRQHRRSEAASWASAAHALAPQAAYAAYGPGHSGAPLARRPTGTDVSHQDQGRGARDVLSATATGVSSAHWYRCALLFDVRRRERAGDGGAACGIAWAAAAGAGSTAHRGADCRRLPFRADSQRSRAADGRTAGEFLQVPWHADACRAGYRSAQDHKGHDPAAFGWLWSASTADGGTDGGSADNLALSQAAGSWADRRQSSSVWSWEFGRWRSSWFSPETQLNGISPCLRWWRTQWRSSRLSPNTEFNIVSPWCRWRRTLWRSSGFAPRDRVQRRLVELKVDVFEVFTQDRVFSRLTSWSLSQLLMKILKILSAQGSEAIFGGGRPVGGPTNFNRVWRSRWWRRAYPSLPRALGVHSPRVLVLLWWGGWGGGDGGGGALAIPRPFPAEALLPALLPGAMLAGLVVHVRALVRRAPPGRAGTVVMGSVAAPVIMQTWLAGFTSLCSLRLMAGCRARRRHRQCYVHGWLCRYAVFFVCRQARDPGIVVVVVVAVLVVVNDRNEWVQTVQKTVRRCRKCSSCGCGRRCEHGAASPSVSRRWFRPVHRQESWDCVCMVFQAFYAIFRTLPNWTRAIFQPLTTHTVSARGLRGCPSRRELFSQVTRHRIARQIVQLCRHRHRWLVNLRQKQQLQQLQPLQQPQQPQTP